MAKNIHELDSEEKEKTKTKQTKNPENSLLCVYCLVSSSFFLLGIFAFVI